MTAVPETHLYDIAVIGAGYVGLPLATTFAEAGQRALVIDVQPHIVDADPEALAAAVAAARMPADRPQLYGDGHASERVAASLHG